MTNKLLQTFNSMLKGKTSSGSSQTISRLKVPLMAFLLLYATACRTNEENYDNSNDLNPKMTELLNEYKNVFNDHPYRKQEREREFTQALSQIDTARTNVEKNIPKLIQKIETELGLEGDSLKNAVLLMDLNTPSAIFADAKLNSMKFNTTLNANVDYTDDPTKTDEINMTPFFAAVEALGQERAALEASEHRISEKEKNTYNTENYAVVLDAGRMSDGMEMHENENSYVNQNAYFFNNEDFPSIETIRETRPGGVVVVTHPNMNPDLQGYLSFLVEAGIKVYVFCVDNALNPVDIDQDQVSDMIAAAQKDPESGYANSNGQIHNHYHSHGGGFYPWYIYSHMYSHPYYGGGSHTSYHTKSVTYVNSNGSRIGMTGKSFKGTSSTFGGRGSGIGRGG